MIIGSKLEPGFGPVIMLGMGGIYVEVLKDVTFKLAPVTTKEADDMITEINVITSYSIHYTKLYDYRKRYWNFL